MPSRASSPLSAIPVLYAREMVAEFESFSPSAAKPRPVVESWHMLGVPLEVSVPEPVTRTDLVRAHSAQFVDGVLEGRVANGFGNRSSEVATSVLWTCGAMLAASRTAISNGRVAAAPCAGFHHARHDRVGAFCTFNGLMVAALALVADGQARRVGILDFDQHYGDGTDDILNRIYQPPIVHYSAGLHYTRRAQAASFLDAIPALLEPFSGCDVILYQAGADPHIHDPLGGWLTTAQLAERDLWVFSAARAMGVPVAWNLAGGYQEPLRKVLDIHDNTMRACAATYVG
jgi:acetoin utilization deacetylase AcuC-like enzyme